MEQKQGFFKEFGELCNKYKVDGITSCEYSCDGSNEQIRVIYCDGKIDEFDVSRTSIPFIIKEILYI